jgi:hypothetical protein
MLPNMAVVVVVIVVAPPPAFGDDSDLTSPYTPAGATKVSAEKARAILDLDIYTYYKLVNEHGEPHYPTPLLKDEYRRTRQGKAQLKAIRAFRQKLRKRRLYVEPAFSNGNAPRRWARLALRGF